MQKILGDATPQNSVELKKLIEEKINDLFGLNSIAFDGADLQKIARIAAAVDSANFASVEFGDAPKFGYSLELLTAAMQKRRIDGLLMEFGVFSGKTINHIASLTDQHVYGFDSFEGLPEAWRPDMGAGAFRGAIPEVAANVELVVGLFDQTLPGFLSSHQGPASLIHVDCDLYSSTKTIFINCKDRITSGTIIVFDEFFNYVGWRNHEYKAFIEFVNSSDLRFKYIGHVPHHQQVAIEII